MIVLVRTSTYKLYHNKKTMSIDKNSSIPLFVQLKQHITNQIDGKQWKPGDQLPSERELSEMFSISRQTVRMAINELVLQGVLQRQSGKGTYVSPEKVTQDLLHVTSFNRMLLDWGKSTSFQKISCDLVAAPAFVQRLLNVPAGTEVIQFLRVRGVENEPMALHRSYIRMDMGITFEDVESTTDSLIDMLNQHGRYRIVRSQETMEPTIADPYEAQLLGVRPGAPLQLITGHLLDASGEPIECHKSLYRGDKFQFAFEGVFDRVTAG